MKNNKIQPPTLKNIHLAHKEENILFPDLIDITVPWKTMNAILKMSVVIENTEQMSYVKLAYGFDLFEFDYLKDVKLQEGDVIVGADFITFGFTTKYGGCEATTMDIPIDALLVGLHCLDVDGNYPDPNNDFCADEYSWVVAKNKEGAVKKMNKS